MNFSHYSSSPRYRKIFVLSFFVGVLAVGILIHRDYGISADERISRTNAVVTAKYLAQRFGFAPANSDSFLPLTPNLRQWKDRDYGVAFELPVYFLEKGLRIKDVRHVHYLNHLCIFLVFWLALYFFYRLVKQRYGSWKLGLVGATMLLLSPRIFADAFYNSKDLVFMSFFLIGIYTLVQFVNRPTLWRAAFHAFVCALTIDTRIMGVLLPLATFAVLCFDFLKAPKAAALKQYARPLVAYLLLLVAFVVLVWPYLWEAPAANFLQAFKNMSKFRWDSGVLFMGKVYRASALPWYYAPLYILITTPIVYTLFFFAGIFLTVKTVVKRSWKLYADRSELQDLLFLGFFALPLMAVILLKSVLYDGWRHLYFLYPAFLLVAIRGLVGAYTLLKSRNNQPLLYGLAALVTVSFLSTAFFIVKEHPHQQVYFSMLPAKTVEQNFERDYWGLSMKDMVGYVLDHDKSDTVYLRIENPWSEQNGEMFSEEDQNRIQWLYGADPTYIRRNKPVYFLAGYRTHPQAYPYKNEVFSQSVSGVKIASVFREE